MPLYSEYVLTDPEWLMEPYILKNEVSGFVGEPKVGKDFLLADIAARLTRGFPMPPWSAADLLAPESEVPGYVIMITPEDKPTDTTGWRLQAAGADMDMVYDLTRVQRRQAAGGMQRSAFTMPQDFGVLKHTIQAINNGLDPDTGRELKKLGPVHAVIMSPLAAISSVSIAHSQTVRHKVMEPLQEISEDSGVATILIMHFNRGSSGKNANLMEKVQGSMTGIVGALRVCSAIMRDDVNPDIRRVMTLASNVAKGTEGDPLEYIIAGEHPDTHVMYKQPLPALDSVSYDTLEARIMAMLASAARPVTSQELAAYTRLTHGIIKQMLTRAQRDGRIERHRGAYTVKAIEA